jgi:hypothetical protein
MVVAPHPGSGERIMGYRFEEGYVVFSFAVSDYRKATMGVPARNIISTTCPSNPYL